MVFSLYRFRLFFPSATQPERGALLKAQGPIHAWPPRISRISSEVPVPRNRIVMGLCRQDRRIGEPSAGGPSALVGKRGLLRLDTLLLRPDLSSSLNRIAKFLITLWSSPQGNCGGHVAPSWLAWAGRGRRGLQLHRRLCVGKCWNQTEHHFEL